MDLSAICFWEDCLISLNDNVHVFERELLILDSERHKLVAA